MSSYDCATCGHRQSKHGREPHSWCQIVDDEQGVCRCAAFKMPDIQQPRHQTRLTVCADCGCEWDEHTRQVSETGTTGCTQCGCREFISEAVRYA